MNAINETSKKYADYYFLKKGLVGAICGGGCFFVMALLVSIFNETLVGMCLKYIFWFINTPGSILFNFFVHIGLFSVHEWLPAFIIFILWDIILGFLCGLFVGIIIKRCRPSEKKIDDADTPIKSHQDSYISKGCFIGAVIGVGWSVFILLTLSLFKGTWINSFWFTGLYQLPLSFYFTNKQLGTTFEILSACIIIFIWNIILGSCLGFFTGIIFKTYKHRKCV